MPSYNMKRRGPLERRTAFDFINYAILTGITFACVIPVLHVVWASFSDPARLAQNPGMVWFPQGFTLKGYEMVLTNRGIALGYANTIFYVVATTSLNILMTALGAFVCSRRQAMLARPITFMITFTMFFGGGLIPFYLTVKRLGLTDTRWAMILPSAVSAWNIIIMRTSMAGLPDSLEESAKIDGANDCVILFRIIMPLIKAVTAVMVLFYAVGHWNSWFNAMIFLRRRSLYPLQLILREILITNDTSQIVQIANANNDSNLYKILVKYCATVVATAPILCVYPFLQRYFVKGVMIGSLKG